MSIDANNAPEVIPQLDLERRQDDVLAQLDDLNERIENLIELYTRLRAADQDSQAAPHRDADSPHTKSFEEDGTQDATTESESDSQQAA